MIEAFSGKCLRTCVPNGRDYVICTFSEVDATALRLYFGRLSGGARYNRFLGAVGIPSSDEMVALAKSFSTKTLVAVYGEGQIIGEARYAFDDATGAVEFALSVADSEQGTGIGTAFLKQIEQHAAHAGAERIFGATLRTNGKMLALAKRSGFRLSHPPGDWTLVRFERHVLDPVWMLPVPQGATAADHIR